MSAVYTLEPFAPSRSGNSEVATTAYAVSAIDVSIGSGQGLQLVYRAKAYRAKAQAELVCPPRSIAPERRDGLWRHTCAELFVRDPEGLGYLEFNFSPSGDWAAYAFDAPRQGQRPHQWSQGPSAPASTSPPEIVSTWTMDSRDTSASVFELRVALIWPALARGGSDRRPTLRPLGLSFVAETSAGLEYWALAHAAPQPDFHHPDGFVGQLEVPACM